MASISSRNEPKLIRKKLFNKPESILKRFKDIPASRKDEEQQYEEDIMFQFELIFFI